MTIPLSFVIFLNPRITWRQVVWGYHHGFLGWMSLRDFANHRLTSEYNEIESEILILGKQDIEEIVEKAEILSDSCEEEGCDSLERFWMLILLAWHYKHNSGIDDALNKAAEVYEDFGCPEDLEEFVRYAPVKDGYDPQVHSLEENLERLMKKWTNYLLKNGIDPENI